MTKVTIFGNANPGVATAVDVDPINLATAFYPFSGTGWKAKGVRFWMNTDSPAITTGYVAYLFTGNNLATATQVATASFGTINKGAWNEVLFSSPVDISTGNYYWAVVYYPQGSYIASSNLFDTSVQSVDDDNFYAASYTEVTPGNGAFDYGAAGEVTGAAYFNATWYGVDVIADDGIVTISQDLELATTQREFYTSTVGENTLSLSDLYYKFLQIETGLTNKSVSDMERVYWGTLAGLSDLSIQDYKKAVFAPYQNEELYWLRAQA